jgi:hypothetical protein
MSATEVKKVKNDLIEWINKLSDVNLLSFLEGMRQSKTEGDWWNNLSAKQIREIEKGLEDIEKGNVISSADFWKRLKNGR